MLRVGLTGELASGKSTVAKMLAERGAIVLSSDEMAREMMQPGQAVFDQIVAAFGAGVVTEAGTLDRRKLASLAFDPARPRIAELNAIVHPPVLAAQARQLAMLAHTDAIVVIESALVFSVADWRERFDCIVLTTAPEEMKIARFVARTAGATQEDARHRLVWQSLPPCPDCLVIRNDDTLVELEAQVDVLWKSLSEIRTGRR